MKRRRGTRFTNHTQVSSADFMGRARVELAPLKNQRLRKWFPLGADSEGKKGSSNVRTRRLVVSSTPYAIDACRGVA